MASNFFQRKWVVPALIFFASALPLAFSVFIFLNASWLPLGHTNHGRLIQPAVKIRNTDVNVLFGNGTLSPSFFLRHWTMVYLGYSHCGADCREALYATRQIRLATGENIRHVQRLYVIRGTHSDARNFLRVNNPDLRVVTATGNSGEAFVRQFTHIAGMGRIYLVGPHGYIMMDYPAKENPEYLLKDLQHLIEANS